MLQTYKAVLHGDRVEWIDTPPPAAEATPVHITVLDDPALSAATSSEALVAVMEEIARAGGLTSFGDASAWQREVRSERPLPGRDE